MLRIASATVAALLTSAAAASAAEPTGVWMVEGGFAHTRIEKCGDKLWGVITWQKTPGGKDVNNPDPAKRDRPTLGMPILLGMAPASEPNRWDGEIYNSENGKLYDANISLKSDDVLKVQGCVLGFLCGGQDWTRVKEPASTGTAGAAVAKPRAPAPKGATATATGAGATGGEGLSLTAAEICTRAGAPDSKAKQPARR